jgi:class 3 adenylate cyclase
MARVLESLLAGFNRSELPHGIESWCAAAAPGELARIDPAALSLRLAVPPDELLSFFFRAAGLGIFRTNWEYRCDRCLAFSGSVSSVAELVPEAFCPVCQSSFPAVLDRNIGVSFSDRSAPAPAPGPAAGPEDPPVFRMMTAFHCMNNRIFRDLLGSREVPAEGVPLNLSSVTVLFAGLEGWSRMCAETGDAAALGTAGEYWKLMRKIVDSAGGMFVRTAGDGVMAVFESACDGMAAALAAREEFGSGKIQGSERLGLVVGLHSGPCVLAGAEGRIDFIGETVNTAHTIMSHADGGGICFSGKTFESPGVRGLISGRIEAGKAKLFHFKEPPEGVSLESGLYRIV